jgi:hypothetical protein
MSNNYDSGFGSIQPPQPPGAGTTPQPSAAQGQPDQQPDRQNPWGFRQGWWPQRVAQNTPQAFIPSIPNRTMAQIGTPDPSLQAARNYPQGALVPGTSMPQNNDIPGLIQRQAMGFGRFGSPYVGMSAIAMGNAANNFMKNYAEGQLARARIDWQNFQLATAQTAERQQEEFIYFNKILALYGGAPNALNDAFAAAADRFGDDVLRNYLQHGGTASAEQVMKYRDALLTDQNKLLEQQKRALDIQKQEDAERAKQREMEFNKKHNIPNPENIGQPPAAPGSSSYTQPSDTTTTDQEGKPITGPSGTDQDENDWTKGDPAQRGDPENLTNPDNPDYSPPASAPQPQLAPMPRGSQRGTQAQPAAPQTQFGSTVAPAGQQPIRLAEAPTDMPVPLPRQPTDQQQAAGQQQPPAGGPRVQTGNRPPQFTMPSQLPAPAAAALTHNGIMYKLPDSQQPNLQQKSNIPDMSPPPAESLSDLDPNFNANAVNNRARMRFRRPQDQLHLTGPEHGIGYSVNWVIDRRVDQLQQYFNDVLDKVHPGMSEADYRQVEKNLAKGDPEMSAMFRAVRKGQVLLPMTGYAANSYFWNVIRGIVLRGDPGYSPIRYNTFQRISYAFNDGHSYPSQVAMATDRALQHMVIDVEMAKHMQQYNITPLNVAKNWILGIMGDPSIKDWQEVQLHLSQELVRVFRGGTGSLSEIQHELSILGSGASPAQIAQVVQTQAALLYGQEAAIANMWNRGTNSKPGDDNYMRPEDFMSPEGRAALNYIFNMPGAQARDPRMLMQLPKVVGHNFDVPFDNPDGTRPIMGKEEGVGWDSPTNPTPRTFLNPSYIQQWNQSGNGAPITEPQ